MERYSAMERQHFFAKIAIEVLARKALASGGIPPGLISCKHLRIIGYRMLGETGL
jgi:hypothetical protein